jgi:hypothetical protein
MNIASRSAAKRAAMSNPNRGEFADMLDLRNWQGVAYVLGVEIGCQCI